MEAPSERPWNDIGAILEKEKHIVFGLMEEGEGPAQRARTSFFMSFVEARRGCHVRSAREYRFLTNIGMSCGFASRL